MNRHKVYLAAVDAYLANDRVALERFVSSRDTDRTERALIESRLRLNAGEYQRAHEILDAVTPQSSLLRGEHAFIRACLLSFVSNWEDAAVKAHQAIQAFLECSYDRGLFIAHYNLSVYYNRLGLEKLAAAYLERAERWQNGSRQRALVLRAKACDASKRLDYQTAILFLEEALNLVGDMDPADQASLEYVAADIYFRGGHEHVALSFLERLNHSKLVRDKARVRFELTVLRALTKQSDTLVESQMPAAVQGNQEYELSWRVLEALQSGDVAGAQAHWQRLRGLLPLKFGHDFSTINPSDANSVFMKAVQRLQGNCHSRTPVSVPLTDRQRQLVELLQSSKVFLRKEEIIERLWGVQYDPSYDNRFYKLVARLRKDAKFRILVVANTYRLVS